MKVRLALLEYGFSFTIHEVEHEQNQKDLAGQDETAEGSHIAVQPRHDKMSVREGATSRQKLHEQKGDAKEVNVGVVHREFNEHRARLRIDPIV